MRGTALLWKSRSWMQMVKFSLVRQSPSLRFAGDQPAFRVSPATEREGLLCGRNQVAMELQ